MLRGLELHSYEGERQRGPPQLSPSIESSQCHMVAFRTRSPRLRITGATSASCLDYRSWKSKIKPPGPEASLAPCLVHLFPR